jgi:hypothetical protein
MVPDDVGGAEGARKDSSGLGAWSTRPIASWNNDEERSEKLQATVTFGQGRMRRFAYRFGRRKVSVDA